MIYKLKQLKWSLQRLIRGYGDDDLWGFSYFVTMKLRKPFKAFVRYQKKHGMGCPPELFDRKNENECHKWITILEKIELAFDLDYEDCIGSDKYFKKSIDQRLKDSKKIKEGFELFGKYYMSFWD